MFKSLTAAKLTAQKVLSKLFGILLSRRYREAIRVATLKKKSIHFKAPNLSEP